MLRNFPGVLGKETVALKLGEVSFQEEEEVTRRSAVGAASVPSFNDLACR